MWLFINMITQQLKSLPKYIELLVAFVSKLEFIIKKYRKLSFYLYN
jgi:hypothetical protein